MSDEGANPSESDLNSIIISFMKKIVFPDFSLIQKEIQHTSDMTYDEYKAMDVHKIPDEEKLDGLEAMATAVRFSQDMSELTRIIRDFEGKKHPLFRLPLFDVLDMTKVFIDDLEELGGLTSDFGNKQVSQVKLFKRMKTISAIFDDLASERLPSTFVTLFEAVVTQYLEPMARKLNPKIRKRKYVSAAHAIQVINQKTNSKHSKLLNVVDCPLRNAIQHESFIDQRERRKYIYSNQEGEEISITYEEMRRKTVYLMEFLSRLEVLIDSKNLVLTIEKVLHLILKKNAMKYSRSTKKVFNRGKEIASRVGLEKMTYSFGLQLSGQYCAEMNYSEAIKEYIRGLERTVKFREEPWYIEDAYGFIIFISNAKKDLSLDNRLLCALSSHLEQINDLLDHEKRYLAKTYLNAGITYKILGNFQKAREKFQKTKKYGDYLSQEEKTQLAFSLAVLRKEP